MRIVYVLGTDGAGKTTVTRRLAEAARPGSRVKYVYCQHRPLLLWLLKLPARLFFMRRTNQFADYEGYKARKDSVRNRRPWLTRVYAWLWYCDVWLQTWPKLLWLRWTAEVVLLDRYYLDWVVNVGELKGNSMEGMLRDARRLEQFLPKAETHIFLDVSEENAFRRKDDIQSVQYLRERKRRYLELAPHYRFQVVDANQDAESVFQQVRRLIDPVIFSGPVPSPSTVSS